MGKKNRNNRLKPKPKPRFLTTKNPASILADASQGSSWVSTAPNGASVTITVMSPEDAKDFDFSDWETFS